MAVKRLCGKCAPEEWKRIDSRDREPACDKCGAPTLNPYTENGRCPDCDDSICDCANQGRSADAQGALDKLFGL